MKKRLLQFILFLLPLCSFAQNYGQLKYGSCGIYIGDVSNNKPWGEGNLTFKWSKKQMENITGRFNGNIVYDAKVDLIPEGCSYSGQLKYTIDDNEGVIVLNFVKGILTLNSKSYKVENAKYVSNSKSKRFTLGNKLLGDSYFLKVEDPNASNHYIVNFIDFYNGVEFPKIKYDYKTFRVNVEQDLTLQLRFNENSLEIVNESKALSTSSFQSKDGEISVNNQTLKYKLSNSSQLNFKGTFEAPNKFNVKELSSIELTLKDKTRIKGDVDNLSNLLFKGFIYFNNSDVLRGSYKLNFGQFNSIDEFVKNATLSDVKIAGGNITKKNGDVIAYKSPEEIKKEKEAQEYKEKLARKKAQQKEDSVWNSIPLIKYSGPYQLIASSSAIEGFASYYYRTVDDKRIYDGDFYYKDNSIAITGQYKKDLKNGKWTYELEGARLKMEVNYKNGVRNGLYKYIQYDRNGDIAINITLKMSNNYVVGIENAWLSKMSFGYDPRVRKYVTINNAQIKAIFGADGSLDEVCEIVEKGANAGKFKFYEVWSLGSLKEKYYYNNMTGDKIILERNSGIVYTIIDIINNGVELAESKIIRGFNTKSHQDAKKKYYFHISWKYRRDGSDDPIEFDTMTY